ncbi:uncharacterized protein LOC122505241 [Leptopilina heterotoma]|uniref:uncharacterized protein LOC122505241 n=1 Tax=Leptopilina heterotoma TaxID=63436 RepID=UPI001CAA35D1|nr:uncharacterized protein LOC122505241 [Leptopilina heterotoma]
MKFYLLACLLIDISISTIIAHDERTIHPRFDADINTILFKSEKQIPQRNVINTVVDEKEIDKLIYNIFHDIPKDAVDAPTQKKEYEKIKYNVLQNSNDVKNSYSFDTTFADALETFTDNLYKTAKKGKSENVLLSPLSVNLALGMIASGAKGNTKREILETLYLQEIDEQTKSNYENLFLNLMNVTGSKIKIFNKMFVSTLLNVKQTYKDVLVQNFHSEEEEINFANAEQAATNINKWVSKATNDKIRDIVSSDDLSTDTAMIVTNVVYFKGEWKYKFSDITNLAFFTEDRRTISVPTMYQNVKAEFGYVPEINATFIELPYKGDELKMIIVLPNLIDGLEQVEKNLETMKLKNLRMKRSLKAVDLYLPKFRVENTIKLNDVLKEMGIKEIFNQQANLSGISEGNIQVNKIKQKTFIEVNENGAEAAAATDTEIHWKMGGEDGPILFAANHPFHYKIIKTVGESDGIVLFAGNYKNGESFHAQSLGSLERNHHVLVQYLKNYCQKTNLDRWLPYAMFSYNIAQYEATGFTPHELIFELMVWWNVRVVKLASLGGKIGIADLSGFLWRKVSVADLSGFLWLLMVSMGSKISIADLFGFLWLLMVSMGSKISVADLSGFLWLLMGSKISVADLSGFLWLLMVSMGSKISVADLFGFLWLLMVSMGSKISVADLSGFLWLLMGSKISVADLSGFLWLLMVSMGSKISVADLSGFLWLLMVSMGSKISIADLFGFLWLLMVSMGSKISVADLSGFLWLLMGSKISVADLSGFMWLLMVSMGSKISVADLSGFLWLLMVSMGSKISIADLFGFLWLLMVSMGSKISVADLSGFLWLLMGSKISVADLSGFLWLLMGSKISVADLSGFLWLLMVSMGSKISVADLSGFLWLLMVSMGSKISIADLFGFLWLLMVLRKVGLFELPAWGNRNQQMVHSLRQLAADNCSNQHHDVQEDDQQQLQPKWLQIPPSAKEMLVRVMGIRATTDSNAIVLEYSYSAPSAAGRKRMSDVTIILISLFESLSNSPVALLPPTTPSVEYLLICLLVEISISIVIASDVYLKEARDALNANTYFTDALEAFSNNFYKTATNGKTKNIFLSPLSANLALAMLASGAKGNTKREILQTLRLPENREDIKLNYGRLYYYLMHDANSKIAINNKVFVNNGLRVKKAFIGDVMRFYYGEAARLNFDETEQASTEINTWASNATNGKIKDIVRSDDLSSDTDLVIANVIYFKDDWMYKFSDVLNMDFYSDSDKKLHKVDMMYQNVMVDYGYVPEINAKFVELPYKNNGLKMIIVLPVGDNTLEQVERKLATMRLKNLRMKRSEEEVEVYLPKFKIESTIDLNSILEEMGMKEAFTSQANLTGIAEGKLNVDKVKQKTVIEVNEDGAEAAAATDISIVYKFGSSVEMFTANRPFHFKIIKTFGENDGIVLFSGNCKFPPRGTVGSKLF